MKRFGYIPDAPDSRDRMFSAFLPRTLALPRSATVWDSSCAIKDQAGTSSCVGQALSQGLRLAYLHRGEPCRELSARFAYRVALTVDGSNSDGGTRIRSAMDGVKRAGCATEHQWPFSESEILQPLGLSAATSAFDRKGLRGYYRIAAGDVDGIKHAVANGYPVVGGWQVSRSFMGWDGAYPIGAQTTDIVGGHALCVVGYDGDVLTLCNSWSSSWGRHGMALVTRDFAAQAGDVWALAVGDS